MHVGIVQGPRSLEGPECRRGLEGEDKGDAPGMARARIHYQRVWCPHEGLQNHWPGWGMSSRVKCRDVSIIIRRRRKSSADCASEIRGARSVVSALSWVHDCTWRAQMKRVRMA